MSNKLLALLTGEPPDRDERPWYELSAEQKVERLYERQKKHDKVIRTVRTIIGFLALTGGATFVKQFASSYHVSVEPAPTPSNPSWIMGADKVSKPRDAGP